jgi:uncharacterized protein
VQLLSEMQARVLACLIEKKETTPEQYPLTTNSLRLACNQKTARNPISNYTEGEVGHTVRELIAMGYAHEAWGARVAKYEHDAAKALGVQGKALALLCPLILRDLDDVVHMLQRLAGQEPALVVCLPRQPGQKEERYAHLLCGAPAIPQVMPQVNYATARAPDGKYQDLEDRISALETQVAELLSRLA